MLQVLRCDSGIDTKMEYEITNMIKVAFEKRFDNYERAKYISDFLDDSFGGCWRVIIGQTFRTCGTFYCEQLLRITYMGELIELFKTQGDLKFDIIEKDPKLPPQVEESILQSINSAQSVQHNTQYHAEYIAAILEAKMQGSWAVVSGYDYNCRIPYVNNYYISVAVKGTRYTIMMLSK